MFKLNTENIDPVDLMQVSIDYSSRELCNTFLINLLSYYVNKQKDFIDQNKGDIYYSKSIGAFINKPDKNVNFLHSVNYSDLDHYIEFFDRNTLRAVRVVVKRLDEQVIITFFSNYKTDEKNMLINKPFPEARLELHSDNLLTSTIFCTIYEFMVNHILVDIDKIKMSYLT